jgi:type IV pilus assembly protein PilC
MQYEYQAKKQSGEVISGKIEAPNEDQAINILHQRGLVVLSFGENKKKLFESDIMSFFDRPSKKDVIIFTRQLATLIDADVPLVEGLRTMLRQIESKSFKKVIDSITSSIEGGSSLSAALTEHNKIFGNFYVSLIRSGEVSGKMHDAMLYLADFLERNASLNSKIKSALSYPAFIFSAMIVVVIILMTSVLPQLLSIIKDAGVKDIPITTQILVTVTDFVNKYIILILITIVCATIGFFYYIKTPTGRRRLDQFKIKAPEFGKISMNFYLARIAETLSTLIKAGVPILEGIDITANVVGNEIYKEILLEARENIRGGGTISQVLEKYKEFPVLVTSMMAIGEKTGRTDFMLENIFKFYKNEAENNIQNLSQLIEPVLILILGIGVAGLVSAVLLPIYSLVSAG